MNALAAKSSSNDSSMKSAGVRYRHTPGPKSVPFFTGTNKFIQTKSICPCDGGCPRCTNEGIIQPKLTIGQPNDKYEQEAESPNITDGLHRIAAEGIRGTGIRVPHFEHIQHYFGHYDLSNVRAHVGGMAREACDELGALAYTLGNHMAFREAPDLGTVAHEVTHVIQQNHGMHPQGGIGQAGDHLERMANRVSIAVEQKGSVDSLLNISSGNELKRAESYSSVQFQETPESSSSPFTGGLPEAEYIFEDNIYVRPLNDGNFDQIFLDQNKVMVVLFWCAHCIGPCGIMADHISAVAESYRTGPYADLVRFYHVQLDKERDTNRIPNPGLSVRFPFTYTPQIYFYYTATGRIPTNEAPLLEGEIQGIDSISKIIWHIDGILYRHGHRK